MTSESAWPAEQLRAVGRAYRATGGRGLDRLRCIEEAEAAFLAMGGSPAGAREAVLGMVAHLAREHWDWLFGPAQEWVDRHGAQEPARADLFEPPESLA